MLFYVQVLTRPHDDKPPPPTWTLAATTNEQWPYNNDNNIGDIHTHNPHGYTERMLPNFVIII